MNSEALCVGARVNVCACADLPAGTCVCARARMYTCVRARDLSDPESQGRGPSSSSCRRQEAAEP